MSVKSRVGTTPNSVVSNPEVQHQWHRPAALARYPGVSIDYQGVSNCESMCGGNAFFKKTLFKFILFERIHFFWGQQTRKHFISIALFFFSFFRVPDQRFLRWLMDLRPWICQQNRELAINRGYAYLGRKYLKTLGRIDRRTVGMCHSNRSEPWMIYRNVSWVEPSIKWLRCEMRKWSLIVGGGTRDCGRCACF
jgi:hypothetical protein